MRCWFDISSLLLIDPELANSNVAFLMRNGDSFAGVVWPVEAEVEAEVEAVTLIGVTSPC